MVTSLFIYQKLPSVLWLVCGFEAIAELSLIVLLMPQRYD